jgi:DNA polymerase II large subunit
VTQGYFSETVDDDGPDRESLDTVDHEADDVEVDGEAIPPSVADYFARLETELEEVYAVAEACRERGLDPEPEVEIPRAEDLAARVEKLVGPGGVAPRIRELQDEMEREDLALQVSKEVAQGGFEELETTDEAIEQAVRTGLAILTEGILVAPLEGIAGVRLEDNDDGSQCVAISFAGPIRAAGGTGQALSVLIADVVRQELDVGRYRPREAEVDRFKEEIPGYKKQVSLQYTPAPAEIDLIARNVPVMVDGEGTESEEVGGNRDLERVQTNALRGGACLVMAEGLTLKASKIQGHVDNLGLDGWEFIDEFVKKQKASEEEEERGEDEAGDDEDEPEVAPDPGYLEELVAGRPAFGHPSRKGTFRLRYGRARTGGLASTAMHPAAMVLCDDFLAVGTQLKWERPGKATISTPCDEVEPPIVLLEDGDLVELRDPDRVREVRDDIAEIVDLGEMLVPFGEFAENNKSLLPSPYVGEWWRQDAEAADAPAGRPGSGAEALEHARTHDVPLHPRYNLFWSDLDVADVRGLAEFVAGTGRLDGDTLVLPREPEVKEALVQLGALHQDVDDELRVRGYGRVLANCLGLREDGDGLRVELDAADVDAEDLLALVSTLAGCEVRDRAPHRMGTRMGRPEKAAARKMSPPVHGLVPLGHAGGAERLVRDAAEEARGNDDETIPVQVGLRVCPRCDERTVRTWCPSCSSEDPADRVHTRPDDDVPEMEGIPFHDLLREAQENLDLNRLPDPVKGVQGLMSENENPEPLEKAILRAKHDIYAFKDGTVRFDMTDVTLTHFRPREVNVDVERLRELGYEEDVDGEPLEDEDQLVELKIQDLVVSEDCLEYMKRTADFVDELLARYYGVEPFYDCDEPEDLVGHHLVGLAPHTSGGVLGRLVGYTPSKAGFAHPYFHAAKRRNCFHGDTEVLVYRDGDPEKTRLRDLVDPVVDESGRVADREGTLVTDAPEDLEVLSLDPETESPRRIAVTKLLRGSTSRWVSIETATHRRIKVTPDHDVLVRRDGEYHAVEATDVREGDAVPAGRSLPRDTEAPTWNLAEVLAPVAAEADVDVRIRGAEDAMLGLLDEVGRDRAETVCDPADSMARTPSRWVRSFPLEHLQALVDAGEATWADVPDEARLGTARDATTLPATVETTPALARLLGLYLAEGHARSTETAHQVSFRTSTPEIRDEIVRTLEEILDLEPAVEEDGTKVKACSRLLYLLLVEAWGAGEAADDKRVPGWCYDLPEEHLGALAGAFLDGDGTLVARPPRCKVYSRNKRLLEDVGLVLQALGIVTRFLPGKPRPPGTFLEARYEQIEADAPDELDPVHQFTVAGRDIRNLAAVADVRHPTKRDRLMDLVEHGPDSRVLHVDGRQVEPEAREHVVMDQVTEVEVQEVADGTTYCLDVDSGSEDLTTKNVLLGNGLYQIRCDGDEDSVMLLLEGLLNFSRAYLPSTRGGQMDAPLTLSTRVDPDEIDGEAHNVDVGWSYPRAFYEATQEHPEPDDVWDLVDTVDARLGSPEQYEGFGFTHDTEDVAAGPDASSYKTIGDMMTKMEAQLDLGVKIRAVDAPDVAARVIGSHFLPDLIGNLKAFSRQEVRCTNCNAKYRRTPVQGRCLECETPTLTLTVHEGSVNKYLEVSKEICERYDVAPYVRQRIEHIEDSIESLFTNDKVTKARISDFL